MILGVVLSLLFMFLSIILINKDFLSEFLFNMGKVSLIIGLFLSLMIIAIDDAYVYHTEVVFEKPIYSLETYPSVRGDFVLGIGDIGSEARYYFYIKNEQGEYELKSVDSEQCSIVETNKQVPRVKKIVKTAEFKSFYYEILGGINIRGLKPEEYYILYVPQNTIKKIYSANICK